MLRNIKPKISSRLIVYAALVLAGVLIGMVLQKYLGLGNILRAVGVPYPTAGAPVSVSVLPLEIPNEYQGEIRLFILAGQSNMVGWAPIPDD